MSGRASPVNGGYEAASAEPAVSVRLTVRKDLFPEVRLPKLASDVDVTSDQEELESISCVKLETDFEQSIDEIANQKLQVVNGSLPSATKPRHRKHKQHTRRQSERSILNGCLPPKKKRRSSPRDSSHRTPPVNSMLKVKGGKNLNLVSSSECQESEEEEEEQEDSESSDDVVLKHSVKLPLVVQRPSGKPYSHELSQLSTKKSKSRDSKERRTHAVIPCSGKPRSMLDICSSRSKKKSKKSECAPTYHSQIVDTTTNLKIKIKRTSAPDTVTPTPISIADLGQRKSKKKRAASPVASESSGEEYDPSRGDTAAISVAAPKPRQPRPKSQKTRKTKNTKSKVKSEKTERSRVSAAVKDVGPQSPWANRMPEEILFKIFDYVVSSQGTLPSVIRLGQVCKLWHSVSCRPELWKNVDLAQYTREKCKTDYKLVWLLENRLSKCQSLNIAQWKVCNVSWVLACVVDYCPGLVELSIAGWSRITPEQLFELVQGLPNLQRLDLSLTSGTGGSSTCLSAASMARLAENFGARFTHLTLANNMFTALPQILTSVAAHFANLEVLDISGALATSHPAAVPLEALQKGCPKVRVFRAANSQLVLAAATTSQQMESAGWTLLEELSIAGEAAVERVAVGEYRLGDEALARLVRGATRLRLLDLRGLQRLTDSGLVRVPAWDLQHLFLGGCKVTRKTNACLELICEKWSHSLIELDLSWASAARALDDAVRALADSSNSQLRVLNLCGSSVSLEPVKKVLLRCPLLESLNLSSCRALPRGIKRLFLAKELQDLKDSFDPQKIKAKEEAEDDKKNKKNVKKKEADSKTEDSTKESPKQDASESSAAKSERSSQEKSSPSIFQEPKIVSDVDINLLDKSADKYSPASSGTTPEMSAKSAETMTSAQEGRLSFRDATPKLLSPFPQSKPDSSSTPRSDPSKRDFGSPHFSPVTKPDSQVQNSPDVQLESVKSNSSWSLGQFRTTPTHKSEASPLNRLESHSKGKHGKTIEQCSPTTSLENRPSPETLGVKQDIKNPNSYYGNYSPMARPESQFSSQRSPYSAQPSPYSTQPSPYSAQPSPYSSQPSPYSAQPSPDTSQMGKAELQKPSAWNSGGYSPMPSKPPAPFSPHRAALASPDPAPPAKPARTPGSYSPLARQERPPPGPYSPRPSADQAPYGSSRSPAAVGNYGPMLGAYGRVVGKANEAAVAAASEPSAAWAGDRFGAGVESLMWGAAPAWGEAGGGGGGGGSRRANPWALPELRAERHLALDTFVEQNVSFESLSGHGGAAPPHLPHHTHHPHHPLPPYLDDGFSDSRVD